MSGPSCCFEMSAEIIRLAVIIQVRFPPSLRSVDDLLHARGIDVCHEAVRFCWDRFGPVFAAEIRSKRAERLWARAPGRTGAGTWTRGS